MKKLIFTFICLLLISFSANALDNSPNWAIDFYNLLNSRAEDNSIIDLKLKQIPENLEYENWFNNLFIKVFQDSEPFFTANELEKIEYALKAKPDYNGTGESYNIFLKSFMNYIFDYGYSLSSNEKTCLNILSKAKPDFIGSEKHFELFISEFDKLISDCEPILTTNEKECIYIVISVKPLSDSDGYKRWNEMYQKFYNSYSPNFNSNEQEILNLILSIKPNVMNDDDNDEEFKKIKVIDLRKLRIHIRNKENLKALQLLDYLID
ncbi:MAG: hypothetical protein M0R46_11340 [Candidatus Muirbacterium halophilum]|nr:hypothetical protein [Candidatus Muirbacterium halophilum]MCK9476507.1 hypothetical protein [Candidatus Muirbacterium halophilum]